MTGWLLTAATLTLAVALALLTWPRHRPADPVADPPRPPAAISGVAGRSRAAPPDPTGRDQWPGRLDPGQLAVARERQRAAQPHPNE